jgi:hypothetical protein
MSYLDAVNIRQGSGDFRQRMAAALVAEATAVVNEVTNEVQSLTLTGTATGGTFTLTFGGQATANLPFNASAAAVQSALQAISTVGTGNVVCTGGTLPGTAVTITFTGTLGGMPLNLLTATNALTGTGSPAPAITRSTAGVAYVNHAARAALAKAVANNPSGYIDTIGQAVANNTTIQADYPPPNHTLAVPESQVDNDILFTLGQVWNTFV